MMDADQKARLFADAAINAISGATWGGGEFVAGLKATEAHAVTDALVRRFKELLDESPLESRLKALELRVADLEIAAVRPGTDVPLF